MNKEWSVAEERELMRGIEQVLRSMLVPELQAIRKQVDALNASLEQRLAFMDRVLADLEEYRTRRRAA